MKRTYSAPHTMVYEVNMASHLMTMSSGEIGTNPDGPAVDSASRFDFSSDNQSKAIWDNNW